MFCRLKFEVLWIENGVKAWSSFGQQIELKRCIFQYLKNQVFKVKFYIFEPQTPILTQAQLLHYQKTYNQHPNTQSKHTLKY